MMRRSKWILLIVVVLALLVWWIPQIITFIKVDDCLDAGGHYVYERGECER